MNAVPAIVRGSNSGRPFLVLSRRPPVRSLLPPENCTQIPDFGEALYSKAAQSRWRLVGDVPGSAGGETESRGKATPYTLFQARQQKVEEVMPRIRLLQQVHPCTGDTGYCPLLV
jgi:hypothetical protein